MKTKYLCPHCRGVINPHKYLILTIQYREKRGLVLLSHRPGDYHSFWDDSFDRHVKRGEPVDFFCPICNADLRSAIADSLVQLTMITSDEVEGRVLFSRVLGEHVTFVAEGEKVIPFGPDSNRFEKLDFSETDSWW